MNSYPSIDRDLLAALNLAQRSGKRRSRGRAHVALIRVARVRDKHTATPRRLRAPRKKRRFPLVTRVDCNSFNVEGRGVIIRVHAGSEAFLLGGSRPVGYPWGDPGKF